MSTLGSLLGMLGDSQIRPWDQAQRSITDAETGLIALAETKRKQAAEAELMRAIQTDPTLRQQLFGGGPVLGSLQTPPGGGAMTQQTTVPGQPPGAPQVIPGGQDLSQFATQGAPQSTIASLGPQPQGSMQAPRNPVLEMAQRDPRAAFLMQQQMQAQQERQWKMEERRLDMGVKVAAAVAQELNAVKDQETLEAARERIRLYHPQAAAQIPQFYSKEALEPLIMKGVAVEKLAEWRRDMATARQTEMMTERLPQVFGALQQFATGAGGTQEAPTGTTTAAASPRPRGTVPGTANLSPQFQTKAQGIADRLETNVDYLYRVMSFETGGEMSPATRNRAGSGATGLIQFTPETAKGLGTTTEALAKMTPEQQLDYVEKYLAPYKGKIGTLKDMYMAVLYPAALGKSEETVLFSPDKTPAAYRQNAGLDTGKKGYVTVGDAVAAVERTTGGGGRGTATTGGTGTAQAPQADPKIAQLDTQIKQGQALALQLSAVRGMEGAAAMVNQQVNDLQKQRDRLEERSTEIPRAVAKQEALEPGELRKQRAGAEVALEGKMNEPIGLDASRKMNLPPGTKWKDVPKDVRVFDDPSAGERKVFSDLSASAAGVKRMQQYLENPEVQKMIGTLFTSPEASFKNNVSQWLSTLTPEQRKFAATVAAEIADIRHQLIGAGQTGIEMASLQPFLPSPGDTDPATLRAKLDALYEGLVRKHDAYRDQLDQLNIRTPKAMAQATGVPNTVRGSNVDKFKKLPGVSQ